MAEKSTSPTSIRQRMKERAKTGKASTTGGQTQLPSGTSPSGRPASEATRTGGPTELKERAKRVYQERTQARPVGEGGAGRLQQVTPKKTPIGGIGQRTPSQMKGREFRGRNAGRTETMKRREPPVRADVTTGKPKPTKTYGERAISYLEGLGTKVAPPGSVTRLRETGARAPRTMSERLGSISRTAQRTFPKEPGTRPGGVINIPEQAARGKGPSLKAQRGTPEGVKRRAAMSLAEKKRRGLRVTGADVPGHGKGPTPVGKTVKAGGAPGAAKVTTVRGRTEGGDLGEYKVAGYVAPKPKPRVVKKKKGYQPPKRAETVREIWGSLFGKKKK